MVEASAEAIAKAKTNAAMASRTNVALSVPMLLCMTGFCPRQFILNKKNTNNIKDRGLPGFFLGKSNKNAKKRQLIQ